MNTLPFVRRACLTVLCVSLMAASIALAQAPQANTGFQPVVGQPGKDVVWVPTPQSTVDKMLEMAKITPQDYLIDLGSGDGRLVITAAKKGLKAHGIEYNQDMVDLSVKNAKAEGVSDRATFAKADLFQSDFSKATVVTMFLLPDINLKLRPTILNMKPGTRIVSNTFTMGDWAADETQTVTSNCPNYCTSLLWIVPAKVDGTWKMSQGELKLKQTYQTFTGTLGTTEIKNGKLAGENITFEVGTTKYEGKVSGNTIQGTARANTTTQFTATR
jgi:16S rRNA A1518/A1519 N6-dimethyltransferase RsmA/KsgA/DIM1 with predicted DNA glycosylase/AP lyase activity